MLVHETGAPKVVVQQIDARNLFTPKLMHGQILVRKNAAPKLLFQHDGAHDLFDPKSMHEKYRCTKLMPKQI